jgi:molybdopterin biosynthesis enzyme
VLEELLNTAMPVRQTETVTQIHHHQGSGVLASTSWSDGLIMIPEGVSVESGERVGYTAFASLLA